MKKRYQPNHFSFTALLISLCLTSNINTMQKMLKPDPKTEEWIQKHAEQEITRGILEKQDFEAFRRRIRWDEAVGKIFFPSEDLEDLDDHIETTNLPDISIAAACGIETLASYLNSPENKKKIDADGKLETVKLLLKHGANIDAVNPERAHYTPLHGAIEIYHWACYPEAHEKIALFLVEEGANLRSSTGIVSPLELAMNYGHPELGELLIERELKYIALNGDIKRKGEIEELMQKNSPTQSEDEIRKEMNKNLRLILENAALTNNQNQELPEVEEGIKTEEGCIIL